MAEDDSLVGTERMKDNMREMCMGAKDINICRISV
jgi:hypothetical protein